jgi:hypothetical protein
MKCIITVPHATSLQNTECTTHEGCDTVALQAARYVRTALNQVGIQTRILQGDINREALDLNRIASRYVSTFRQTLRDMVDKHTFVLDMHSYPSSERWGLSDAQPAIFLLEKNNIPISITKFQSFFAQTPILQGVNNDIQDEMMERDIPCILLELNEDTFSSVLPSLTSNLIYYLQQ